MSSEIIKKVYHHEDVIYEVDDESEVLYYLIHGRVDIYRNDKGGDILLTSLYPGKVFGTESFFGKRKHEHRAIAGNDIIVYLLDRASLPAFIQGSPSVAMDIIAELGGKLGILTKMHLDTDSVKLSHDHHRYLYATDMDCPICGNRFKMNKVRYARLQIERVDEDFRNRYVDFDDLWYQIIRCPYCSYLNFYDKFDLIDKYMKQELRSALLVTKPQYLNHIKYNVEDVLKEYEDLKLIIESFNMDAFTKARLWQSIAWLQEDVGNKELVDEANEKLLGYLEQTWMKSSTIDTDKEIKLAYKLALLYERKGDINQSLKYLHRALEVEGAKKVLIAKVRDKLYDLRKLHKIESVTDK